MLKIAFLLFADNFIFINFCTLECFEDIYHVPVLQIYIILHEVYKRIYKLKTVAQMVYCVYFVISNVGLVMLVFISFSNTFAQLRILIINIIQIYE